MHIALNIAPLTSSHSLQHRVRGTGFYTENLKHSLVKFFPEYIYEYFTDMQKLDRSVDIVHYPYFEPFFLTLPLIKRFPTVVTVHDLTPFVFPKYFPSGARGLLRWSMQKLSLKNCAAIITDSQSSKNDIIKYAGVSAEKITVIYLAAGEEYKKREKSKAESVRKKYNLPKNFCLYVGDVTWNKNLPRLVRAIKKTSIPLIMVGKALLEENFDHNNPWNQDRVILQKLCKDDKNIFRLGFIPNDDLVSLYNIADVFAMPSFYEGFGLPVLEAMNCGTPVVTTREGSIEEVAGDAPYYVDAYSEDSISMGIKKVFSDKTLRQELSKKSLQQAKKFSWKATAAQTVGVYKSVLKSR